MITLSEIECKLIRDLLRKHYAALSEVIKQSDLTKDDEIAAQQEVSNTLKALSLL